MPSRMSRNQISLTGMAAIAALVLLGPGQSAKAAPAATANGGAAKDKGAAKALPKALPSIGNHVPLPRARPQQIAAQPAGGGPKAIPAAAPVALGGASLRTA